MKLRDIFEDLSGVTSTADIAVFPTLLFSGKQKKQKKQKRPQIKRIKL